VLACTVQATDAELYTPLRDTLSSELVCFNRIFGDWAATQILPVVNSILAAHRQRTSNKHLTPLTRDDLMHYFLFGCLQQLRDHRKHRIPNANLAAAQKGLMGQQRHKAIHSVLNIPDHQLAAIIASWPQHIRCYLVLGWAFCLDETIVPYYGKKAKDEGKLRSCPNKPHNYGMWVWALAQRLKYSGLAVSMGLLPAFFAPNQSPGQAASALLRPFLGPPVPPVLMIADSLWCNGATSNLLQELGVRYLISVKSNNGIMSDAHLTLAQSDLPAGTSRTYINGPNVLQVRNAGGNDLFGLVTNNWTPPDARTPRERKGAYETALALNRNESSATLVKLFERPAEDAQMAREQLIFKITGWDVLRQRDKQESAEPLSYEAASKWPRETLARFYEERLNKKSSKKMTMQNMLHELFGVSGTSERADGADEVSTRKRTREQVTDLSGLRETVRRKSIRFLLF
jgi:hypothetical protein